MWKVNLFCDKHVFITYWLKKRIRKFTFLKYSFFWKSALDDIILENFTLPNSTNLVEDLIRWKKGFETFLIDHYAGDIGNKNITGKY